MAVIWLGDSRLKQLQLAYSSKDKKTNSKYLASYNADCDWFRGIATAQLIKMYMPESDVVIMSGFNDCIYSCVWSSFNIKDIAIKYAKIINEQIELYPDLYFNVCTIGPISNNYAFDGYKDGIIPKSVLNNKIKLFNETLAKECKANLIDCYDYLNQVGFKTRDGVNYKQETLELLREFILSQLKAHGSVSFFHKRITDNDIPKSKLSDGSKDTSFDYWTTGTNGLNKCTAVTGSLALPNCVGYAWGRFYEITGEEPKLSTKNAERWYTADDGYERSDDPSLPREGAVICWQHGKVGNDTAIDGDDAGHVAIVEQVNKGKTIEDTTLIISESAYRKNQVYDPEKSVIFGSKVYNNQKMTDWHFKVRELKYNNGNWTDWSGYDFQGFIYCPIKKAVSNDELCTENSYGISVDDMKPNAQYIWQFFSQRGWTINAVAALLGNIQAESKMSPCVWEGTINGSIIDKTTGKHSLNNKVLAGFDGGYGLTQWTPYTKYYNWCQDGSNSNKGKKNSNDTGEVLPYWEMDSQLKRIDWEARYNKQWSLASYNRGWKYKNEAFDDLTFKAFRESKKDPDWLAAAFAYCYERSWFTDWTDSDDNGAKPGLGLSVAEERLAVCTERGKNATYWYNYLKTVPLNGFEDKALKVVNFKIDSCKAPKIQFSFCVKNAKSGSYKLKTGNSEIINKKITKSEDGLNVITLNNKKIKPNTKYTLELTFKGEEKDDKYSEKLTFTAPQDPPDSVKDIILVCNDKIKTPSSTFNLKLSAPSYKGYWNTEANKVGGYNLGLFVNGKKIKTTKNITGLTDVVITLDLKKDFNYTAKFGDTIQFGARTFTKDDVFDSTEYKTSNTILLLNNSIQAYLCKK